jgi:hypothetical protein
MAGQCRSGTGHGGVRGAKRENTDGGIHEAGKRREMEANARVDPGEAVVPHLQHALETGLVDVAGRGASGPRTAKIVVPRIAADREPDGPVGRWMRQIDGRHATKRDRAATRPRPADHKGSAKLSVVMVSSPPRQQLSQGSLHVTSEFDSAPVTLMGAAAPEQKDAGAPSTKQAGTVGAAAGGASSAAEASREPGGRRRPRVRHPRRGRVGHPVFARRRLARTVANRGFAPHFRWNPREMWGQGFERGLRPGGASIRPAVQQGAHVGQDVRTRELVARPVGHTIGCHPGRIGDRDRGLGQVAGWCPISPTRVTARPAAHGV